TGCRYTISTSNASRQSLLITIECLGNTALSSRHPYSSSFHICWYLFILIFIFSLNHINIFMFHNFGVMFIIGDNLFLDDDFFGHYLFLYDFDPLFCDRDAHDTFFVICIIMTVCFKQRLVFELASFDGDMFMVDRHIKFLNFGLGEFVDDDFADLFLFLIYDKLFFSQVKTLFIGVFHSPSLRRTGQIVFHRMIEICTSAWMLPILLAVFIFRTREFVEGMLVIIDVKQQQSLIELSFILFFFQIGELESTHYLFVSIFTLEPGNDA